MRATRSIMNKRVLSRLARRLLQAGVAAVFFGTASHHVYSLDFKPLAALCIPVLAVFFTFTSLLYIRGRSLARRRAQFRTLFARLSVTWPGSVGTSFYGLLQYVPFSFDPRAAHCRGVVAAGVYRALCAHTSRPTHVHARRVDRRAAVPETLPGMVKNRAGALTDHDTALEVGAIHLRDFHRPVLAQGACSPNPGEFAA